MQLIQLQALSIEKMMQLIQLHTLLPTWIFVFSVCFILGGPPGAPGPRPPQNENMQLNQLHHYHHGENYAAESTA